MTAPWYIVAIIITTTVTIPTTIISFIQAAKYSWEEKKSHIAL